MATRTRKQTTPPDDKKEADKKKPRGSKPSVVDESSSSDEDKSFSETIQTVLAKQNDINKDGEQLRVKVMSVSNTLPAFKSIGQTERKGTPPALQFITVADKDNSILVEIRVISQVNKLKVGQILLLRRWSYVKEFKLMQIVPGTQVYTQYNTKLETIDAKTVPDATVSGKELEAKRTKTIAQLRALPVNNKMVYNVKAVVAKVDDKIARDLKVTGETDVAIRNVMLKDGDGEENMISIGLWRDLADTELKVGSCYMFYNIQRHIFNKKPNLTSTFGLDTRIEETTWSGEQIKNLEKVPDTFDPFGSSATVLHYKLTGIDTDRSLVYPACRSCNFKKLTDSGYCDKCSKHYQTDEKAAGCMLWALVRKRENGVFRESHVKLFTASAQMLAKEAGNTWPKKYDPTLTNDQFKESIVGLMPNGIKFTASSWVDRGSNEVSLNVREAGKISGQK